MSHVQTREPSERSEPAIPSKLRVLVVDDSAIYRKILRQILGDMDGVEVVATASNGRSALQLLDVHKPDMMTLDMEMPDMDGIDVLKQLRAEKSSVSAIMISSHTQAGADATIQALQEGAFDFIVKPNCSSMEESMRHLSTNLFEKICAHVTRMDHKRRATRPPAHLHGDKATVATPKPAARWTAEAVAIGISTGGPEALRVVIPALPADLSAPILIVQHMPPVFTKSLAQSLNNLSPIRVLEAEQGMQVESRTVYIAPGGQQMRVVRDKGRVFVRLTDDPPENSCKPAVDYLFRSMIDVYKSQFLAVIMTGMGHDGTQACRQLKQTGARLIAQSESSCVVFGMPKLPIIEGIVDEVLDLNEISSGIIRLVEGGRTP